MLSARYFTGDRFEDRISSASKIINDLGRIGNGWAFRKFFESLVYLNEEKISQQNKKSRL